MIKKTISYMDYDGNLQTEDFYFNLSKAELAEIELSTKGGLEFYISTLIKTEDGEKLVKLFKEVILRSIGIKSSGRFIKNEEIRNNFLFSEAYSELFTELVTNSEAAVAFVNGIIPQVPSK